VNWQSAVGEKPLQRLALVLASPMAFAMGVSSSALMASSSHHRKTASTSGRDCAWRRGNLSSLEREAHSRSSLKSA
jgi:hypothetical protein